MFMFWFQFKPMCKYDMDMCHDMFFLDAPQFIPKGSSTAFDEELNSINREHNASSL